MFDFTLRMSIDIKTDSSYVDVYASTESSLTMLMLMMLTIVHFNVTYSKIHIVIMMIYYVIQNIALLTMTNFSFDIKIMRSYYSSTIDCVLNNEKNQDESYHIDQRSIFVSIIRLKTLNTLLFLSKLRNFFLLLQHMLLFLNQRAGKFFIFKIRAFFLKSLRALFRMKLPFEFIIM